MSTRRSRLAATRAAWRIARRDAWRHKARSLLVIVMIGLPVAGVVFFDVTYRTSELSSAQLADRVLGERADALLQDSGADSVTQLADPAEGWLNEGDGAREEPLDLEALLPSSWSWVTSEARGPARFLSADGERAATAELQEIEYADPLLAGLVRQVDGREPTGAGEVVLTRSYADRLDLGVGDRLVSTDDGASFEVVGVVELPNALKVQTVIGDPGAFDGLLGSTDPGSAAGGVRYDLRTYVDAGGDVTWEQVQDLNESGLLVTSRAVLVDPPPCGVQPCGLFGDDSGLDSEAITLIALLVVMLLLQVVLLAGPAFAIGRRTQSRDLALVAASGGDRRHVGGVVRGGGIVLGAVGAVLGAALAIVGFLLFEPQLSRAGGSDLPTIDLRFMEILAVVGIGVLTGLVAAWLPARQASRQDVVAALGGRRPTPRIPRLVPALGAVAVAVGAVVALYGAGPGDALAIVAGSVVAELGLVAMSPTLVAWVARIGPRLPAVPRLALRDAARARTRSGPAVAAVMAAVAGAVAVSIFATSQAAADERGYSPSAQMGWATVSGTSDSDNQQPVEPLVEAAARALPVERTWPVQAFEPDYVACGTTEGCLDLIPVVPAENRCPLEDPDAVAPPTDAERARLATDPRCTGGRAWSSPFGPFVVGDADTYAALTGSADPAVRAVLDQGGVVAFEPANVLDGQATLEVSRVQYLENGGPPEVVRSESFPAVYADPRIRPALMFLSPEAAAALDLTVRQTGALLETSRMPTQEEEDRAARAIELEGSVQAPAYLAVERGYDSDVALALLVLIGVTAVVALGATGIAVGLAAADAKPDLATLAAVGAAPRTRRLLTASQALVIAGLGTLLGIAAGFVPGVAAVRTQTDWSAQVSVLVEQPRLPVVVPWWTLVLLVVAVPLLAAVCGALFSRSRLPMVRRLT